MLETDDKIPGPGMVVRIPLLITDEGNIITITCERNLIIKARNDFEAGKLNLGNVPTTFVKEILEICVMSLCGH